MGIQILTTSFQVNLEPPRIIEKKKAYRLDACLSPHILVRILEAEPKFIRL